ncbi:MAG TPA: hypothetical protein VI893_08555 [Thermoplasmata archaeon]|nr:hypothetical protein [Thermoplasmata archaeon]
MAGAKVAYSGNGAYCYANSLHMALRAHGADPAWLPAPGFLEVLTTMPFGNMYMRLHHGPMVFFSPPSLDPDQGIDVALRALGWKCETTSRGTGPEALARLRAATKEAPVLAGPVDMGYFTHNPRHLHIAGADHFVLVLGIEGDRVRMHDPEGFPFASIPSDDFLRAWQADRIDYKHEPFTMRSGFAKFADRSRKEMIERTLPLAKKNLEDDPGGPRVWGGLRALHFLAEDLKGKVSQYLSGHLTWFAFPLAARRCADAAAVMSEMGKGEAASVLEEKARIFGEAQFLGVQARWASAAGCLSRLADLEIRLMSELP